jgi:steroid delta-isomerase-like uncharacterized protein
MRATVITTACLVMLASSSAQEGKKTTPAMASAEQTPAAATATTTSVRTPIKESATERGRHAPDGMVEHLFAAWSSHDPDRVVAFYTDGIGYKDIPLKRTSSGKTELRKFVEDTFAAFPDLKVEVVSSSICGGHGVSEVVWSATDKGFLKTNKRFSVRMVSVFELHEGKISRNEDFYDLSTIMRQIGALPADELGDRKETDEQTRIQTSQSGKSVLEAYVSAWNRHDFAALDKLLTPDAVHEDVAQGVHAQGVAEIKKFMREEIEGEPDVEWRLTRVVDGGSTVAAEWTWTGTFTGEGPTGPVKGERISGRGASIVITENGLIKRFTDYYDLASFFPKTSAANATLSDDDLSAKQQVLDLGKEWVAAEVKHDATALRRILDEKFVASFGADKPYDKEAFIKEILAGDVDPTESQTLTDESVVIDHDTAVVVGTDSVRGTNKGVAYSVVYRYTVTYIRRHGEWVALAEHLLEAPQSK